MSGHSNDESAEFIEHARWLLEWHNKRGEAFTTRAVALLGFNGVILAVLLQGAGLDGIDASGWTWTWLAGTVALLLASALFSLLTILPAEMVMPGIPQLRHWWKVHSASPTAGFFGPQVAESLLYSRDITGRSPLSDAKTEADLRAKRFKWSIRLMLAGFIVLSFLVVNVMHHAWGGDMSEHSTENTDSEPKPEPLKFDTPVFDYIEKSGDQGDLEKRDLKPGETK